MHNSNKINSKLLKLSTRKEWFC